MNKKAVKNIIFLIESPLSERDKLRFGYHIFLKNNFNVIYFDLTKILFPEWLKKIEIPSEINDDYLFKFESISAVLKAIKKKENLYFISLISYNIKTRPLFKFLTKNNLKYAFFINSHVYNLNRNFLVRLRNITLKKIKLAISERMNKLINFKSRHPADLVITTGSKVNLNDPRICKNTKQLWLHSWDYDLALINSDNYIDVSKKYIVFIDNNLPFHTDTIRVGVKPHEDPHLYFKELCNFFEFVEQKTGYEIIIAAHPRSNYGKDKDFFKGRRIIKNKTDLLIKNCSLVITHLSASISFAVIYKKPLLFITTNRLIKTKFRYEIPKFASLFNKTVHNISKNYDFLNLQNEMEINKHEYNEYFTNYIKYNNNNDEISWQTIANYISNNSTKNS